MSATAQYHDLTASELARRWWRPAVAVLAVAVAVAWRLVKNELGAPVNLELSTAAAFLAAALLRHRVAALAPLVVVAASDLVLGNSAALWFTWSAWAAIGVGALWTRRAQGGRRFLAALGLGAGGSAFFFLWTNMGVWLEGRGIWYPAGLDGLLASYVAGLPFWRTMLLGNLVLVPAAAGVAALVERWEQARERDRGCVLLSAAR